MHTTHEGGKAERVIIVVWDGMRLDFVSLQYTPNLWELAQGGVTFTDNHSCFPTLTRLNFASISTGAYPCTHGFMGNTVFVSEIDSNAGISTGDYENLIRFDGVTGGNLLRTDSLAQIVGKAGGSTVIASSCSTGTAFLYESQAGWPDCDSQLYSPKSAGKSDRGTIRQRTGSRLPQYRTQSLCD